VLSYRARLAGPAPRLVGLRVGPLQAAPPGEFGPQRAAVIVRYTLLHDPVVRSHRGWLYAWGSPGAQLQVVAYQVDGSELLLSLRPVTPRGAPPQEVVDRLHLPFRFQAWGVGRLLGGDCSLRLACRRDANGLLLSGAVRLLFQTDSRPIRLMIPFVRFLSGAADSREDSRQWRASGSVLSLNAEVAGDGTLTGAVELGVWCRGRPFEPTPGSASGPAQSVAAWREVAGAVGRVRAEVPGPAQILVHGEVDLDLYWADRSGKSRWAGRALPFSGLAQLDGVSEGDRVEAVAQIERLRRIGDGDSARVMLLLAVGLTATRQVVQRVDGRLCRLEEVVGQCVVTFPLDQPLWVEASAAQPPAWRRSLHIALRGASVEGRSVRLPWPLGGLFGITWSPKAGGVLLARPRRGRLQAVPIPDLSIPELAAGVAAITAYGSQDEGEGPRQVEFRVEWQE